MNMFGLINIGVLPLLLEAITPGRYCEADLGTDECDGGYYLYSRSQPGDRIAIRVQQR